MSALRKLLPRQDGDGALGSASRLNPRRQWAKWALLVASSAIAVLLAESLTRLLAPQNVYPDRHIFLSSSHFQVDSVGAVRYLPKERVRMVAISNSSIEYDVEYNTNNAGFIDHQDYQPIAYEPRAAGKKFAIVGDSFAAGVHGGDPWIPRLRDAVQAEDPSVMLYNLGVEGTGPAQFRRLLVSVANEIPFDNIVIMAISDDFRRPMWRPLATNGNVYFCAVGVTDRVCATRLPFARIINFNSTMPDLLRMSEEISRAHSLFRSPILHLEISLKQSHFVVLLARAFKRLTGLQPPPDYRPLREIRQQFGNLPVHLVHLPQENEVRAGHYDLDLQRVTASMGIRYFPALTRCEWSPNMFYRLDGHPNAEGYQAISNCVSKYLGLRGMRRDRGH